MSYVRLTPLGAYCLGLFGDYEPPRLEPRAVLSVLSTLEVVATERSLNAPDRIVLDRYADAVSDCGGSSPTTGCWLRWKPAGR